ANWASPRSSLPTTKPSPNPCLAGCGCSADKCSPPDTSRRAEFLPALLRCGHLTESPRVRAPTESVRPQTTTAPLRLLVRSCPHGIARLVAIAALVGSTLAPAQPSGAPDGGAAIPAEALPRRELAPDGGTAPAQAGPANPEQIIEVRVEGNRRVEPEAIRR